ncbi:hypothetical protein E2C01_062453 [Portunus trituberculatus]|uniref:Uncharacterized protein n=1 Tax=Portunus trituberculatus TaxID=210409 RepID=A0A5B7HFC9_PORTR|nr:hypothetical protein [Portunus trituberculatus]
MQGAAPASQSRSAEHFGSHAGKNKKEAWDEFQPRRGEPASWASRRGEGYRTIPQGRHRGKAGQVVGDSPGLLCPQQPLAPAGTAASARRQKSRETVAHTAPEPPPGHRHHHHHHHRSAAGQGEPCREVQYRAPRHPHPKQRSLIPWQDPVPGQATVPLRRQSRCRRDSAARHPAGRGSGVNDQEVSCNLCVSGQCLGQENLAAWRRLP